MEGTRKAPTFPTAASPSRTSFTLLLGFGATAVESAMLLRVLLRVLLVDVSKSAQLNT